MSDKENQNYTNNFQQSTVPQGNSTVPVNPEPFFNFHPAYWKWFNNLPDCYPLPFPMHINGSIFLFKFLQKPLNLCPSKNPADIFIENTNSANVVAPLTLRKIMALIGTE